MADIMYTSVCSFYFLHLVYIPEEEFIAIIYDTFYTIFIFSILHLYVFWYFIYLFIYIILFFALDSNFFWLFFALWTRERRLFSISIRKGFCSWTIASRVISARRYFYSLHSTFRSITNESCNEDKFD